MNARDDLERDLRAMLADAAPRGEPERLFAAVMASTQTVRQRPGFVVGLRSGDVESPPRTNLRLAPVVLAALILAGLLGAILLLGSRIAPAPSPLETLLSIGYDDGLVIARGDGSDPRRIRDDGAYGPPVWSQDGLRLASLSEDALRVMTADGVVVGELPDVADFVWLGADEIAVVIADPDGSFRERVVGADGSVSRELGTSPSSDVAFRHDGNGFAAADPAGAQPARIVAHRPGGAEREVVRIGTGRLWLPAWDPHDREIAYVVTPPTDCVRCGGTLTISSESDGSVRRLIDRVGLTERPIWSPDASRLLITRWVAGQSDLYVIRPDGTGIVQLTNDLADERAMSWAPSGDRILYTSVGAEANEVWSVGADGSGPSRLASGAITSASWQPVGTRTADGLPSSLPIAASPTGAAPSTPTPSSPAIPLDEPWIVFESTVTGARDGLFLMRPDGTGMHQIAADIPGTQQHADWSPDGSKLAFEVEGDIWIADADGSDAVETVTCPGSCDAPAWSPDGQKLAYTALEGAPGFVGPAASSINVIDLRTQHVATVVRAERPLLVDVPRWSPSGTELVVGVDQMDPEGNETGASIAIVPVQGGVLRYLTDVADFAYHPDWSWTTGVIAYSNDVLQVKAPEVTGDDTWNLHVIEPDGTGARTVTDIPHGQRLWHASWTPDGTRIIADFEGNRVGVFADAATGQITLLRDDVIMTHPRLRPTP